MIACPGCKRRIFTARDMLYASLDGAARCRACGKLARLDLLSRWMIATLLALFLPMVLLYADVFYSGHLFFVSVLVILCAWRLLAFLGAPVISLELVPRGTCLDQRQSVITLAVIVTAALVMDGFMAYRINSEEAPPSASVSAGANGR